MANRAGRGQRRCGAGIYAPVPVLIGANSADGFPRVTDKAAIFATYGADADKARALYDPQGTATGLVAGTMTSADRMFIEPARAVARLPAASRCGSIAWLCPSRAAGGDGRRAACL
jgi:para-nitrobenzyl esterase